VRAETDGSAGISSTAQSVDAPPDWPLTEQQLARLARGEVLVDANVVSDRAMGDVLAAVQIDAPPEQVFRTLTDCSQALEFVPHLEHCAVLETAPDGSWQDVEQTVNYGWYMPRAYYVFRADYEPFRRIHLSNLRGDFRENHGVWEFRPVNGGAATIVTYRLRLVPRFYVPRWVMRSTLRRDLPEMLRGLRMHSQNASGPGSVSGALAPNP